MNRRAFLGGRVTAIRLDRGVVPQVFRVRLARGAGPDAARSRCPSLRPVRECDASHTVRFRSPSERVVNEFAFAKMGREIDGRTEPCAHVVVMPHATRDALDRFLESLARG